MPPFVSLLWAAFHACAADAPQRCERGQAGNARGRLLAARCGDTAARYRKQGPRRAGRRSTNGTIRIFREYFDAPLGAGGEGGAGDGVRTGRPGVVRRRRVGEPSGVLPIWAPGDETGSVPNCRSPQPLVRVRLALVFLPLGQLDATTTPYPHPPPTPPPLLGSCPPQTASKRLSRRRHG